LGFIQTFLRRFLGTFSRTGICNGAMRNILPMRALGSRDSAEVGGSRFNSQLKDLQAVWEFRTTGTHINQYQCAGICGMNNAFEAMQVSALTVIASKKFPQAPQAKKSGHQR
jgi:hypothetical protein